MSNLLLFIAIVSILAVFAFAGIAVVNYIGKNKERGKKSLKKSGISLVVMIVSFIAFGITSDQAEPKKVVVSGPAKVVVDKVEKEPKLSDEQKVELEKKEADEKAAAELKAKEEEATKAKAEADRKAKEEADAKKIKPGTYKVGSEIPVGEYLVHLMA